MVNMEKTLLKPKIVGSGGAKEEGCLIKPVVFENVVKKSGENLIKPVIFENVVKKSGESLIKPAVFEDRGIKQKEEKCGQILKIETGIGLPSFDTTDSANVERFLKVYNNEVLYNCSIQAFMLWNGKYWQIDTEDKVMHMCNSVLKEYRESVRCLEFSKEARDQEIYQHSRQSCNLDRIRALYAMLKYTLAVSGEKFDTYHDLLNVNNGIVNLKTGDLIKHERNFYFSKCIPVDYVPKRCRENSLFKKFLFEVCCGDMDLIYFLKSVFGYAITGETTEQVFFIMHGTGSNGKTTLINAIENVLRPYVCRMPIGVLMGKTSNGGGKPTPELARAISSRLVFASESNEGEVLNEAKIKNLTGGEEIIVRPLYKDVIQFSPTFKLFLDTNYLPHVKGLDYAIWRRIKVIPFRATFDAGNADKDLMSKLKTQKEAEGILAFLVEGAILYYRNKILECDAVNNATSEFRFLCDTIGRFLSCRVKFGNNFDISATKLYQLYLKFCDEENLHPVNITDFGRILNGKGICKKHRRNGNFYIGITCEECEG